jgi:hypothetical protein
MKPRYIPMHAARRYKGVEQISIGESVTYYHIETPNYFKDDLVVEGAVIESYGRNFVKENKLPNQKFYTWSQRLNGYTRYTTSVKPLYK